MSIKTPTVGIFGILSLIFQRDSVDRKKTCQNYIPSQRQKTGIVLGCLGNFLLSYDQGICKTEYKSYLTHS